MLQAFIDDSRSEQEPETFMLGGYIATAETWAAFSTDWDRALYMRPRLRYFKLREAIRGEGEFNGASPESREERIGVMRGVIEKHDLKAFSIGFHVKDLEETHEPFDGAYMNPYYSATLALIPALARALDDFQLPRDRLDIVFDNQVMEKARIFEAFEDAKAQAKNPTPPDLLTVILRNSPRWDDDKVVLPLQAADMQVTWARMKREAESAGLPVPLLPNMRKSIVQVEFWLDRKYFEAQAARIMGYIQAAMKAAGEA